MKPFFTSPRLRYVLILFVFSFFGKPILAQTQLGIYSFTGNGSCPNQNSAVTSQPANAVFSNYASVNTSCQGTDNVFDNKDWNTTSTLDLTEYNQFTITPNTGFTLTLSSLIFTEYDDQDPSSGSTNWYLRSSIDNYASDVATGTSTTASQIITANLPTVNFTNIGAVTFRLYITNAKGNGTKWTNDDIKLNGFINGLVPANPANPVSNSPQCANPGVTMNFSGTPPTGETWYWETSSTGTSTANTTSSYTITSSGTYYVRSQDNTTLAWSNGAGSISVVVTPNITAPVFVLGSTSTRCQGAGTATYTASSTNATSIVYSVDATSAAAGNYISDATAGVVTYTAGWSGTTTITATAYGCNGPVTSTHTVTVTSGSSSPVFSLGSTSTRCQSTSSVNVSYTATASNTTGITYSLDATTNAFAGNSINTSTGVVTYSPNWSGTTIITASAAGCAGPQTGTHTVTITPTVSAPVFSLGSTSTRCQGAATVNYTAIANNTTGITYSLNAASLSAGNTINSATGDVTYVGGYNGTTTITASAAGCNGPKTATHTETVTATVGVPVFSLGGTSTRCQASGNVTYTATATTNTGITYALDATSLAGGNNINTSTGVVSYVSGWSGTSVITATATGCNGPTTANHTVTVTPVVSAVVFDLGSGSTRCQGAGTITYNATANNTTGITYALDVLSVVGGNTINSSTGAVTFSSLWSGTTYIQATAAGCTSQNAIHTVTVTPTVGAPVFALGSSTTRCQGAGAVTYTATATNNTGITYTLDATSIAGNNTINSATGAVTYNSSWIGVSTITATATGCNGPKSSNHTETTNGPVSSPVFSLGSTSTRCQSTSSVNVSYTATASNTTGITYSLDATTNAFAGNSINTSTGVVTYSPNWSGTTIITASAAGCAGPQTGTHTVTITPTVSAPVFSLGSTSTRCQGAATVNYTAIANNTTGITYSLNAASLSAGNTINSATGDVTYVGGYNGTTTITASAAGCNGPKTATHTETVTATVGVPVFSLGGTSTRCQASGNVTYTATATTNTGITYALDATSLAGGNNINTSTGVVSYVSGWSGTSVITATATGCNGPTTANHTVTVTPVVSAVVFDLGSGSTRCQGAGTITYNATANNTTGITYALDATSRGAGNTINATTGAVTYVSGWNGTSTVTATASGCSPQSGTHTVIIIPTVGAPVFALGSSTTRCQSAGAVTYTATATNNTGITYTLDATSIVNGNTIDATTGAVTYAASWSGTTTITATATGCNGPKTTNHTVTVTGSVATPIFGLGSTSTRCQGAGTVSYNATAANSTGLSYSLDAASISGGNSINSITGNVAFVAGWSGTSTITCSATGCSGPVTASHIVTITPTVGTPVFALGASTTRCQGIATQIYTATATNNSGISYSLDGTSVTGGNSISATGTVTWAAGWSGTSTIIAVATGCNGPKTATHVVTVTPTVGTPVFSLGLESVRSQGSGNITYTATATNSTSIAYNLDAASLSGGNTINAATGVVSWVAGWYGTSLITATAQGCNGPSSSSHIVTINPSIVETPLYLSDPGQVLDRIDPVTTGLVNTVQTTDLTSFGSSTITFTQSPTLCSDLIIKAQTISVISYISITNGSMPVNPSVTAVIKYGNTNIITLSNPIYNAGSNVITWTGTLGADVTVPAGQAISLQFTTFQNGVTFKILYHSASKPSRISLLPVSTFIDVSSFNIYNAPYPGGSVRINGNTNTTYYARAVVTTPFGYKDITGLTVNISPTGINYTAACVDSTSCTRTYEYVWTTPSSVGNYFLMATAKEGYENIIKNSELINFSVCTFCPPVALDDSASGAGGAPIILDVLANDYDPNNNIQKSTLTIVTQSNNGTGYISNGKLVYLPNGTYAGRDTLVYRICDSTGLCAIAKAIFTINPTLIDPCSDATKTHVYFIPYPEQDAYTALLASSNTTMPSNNIRTIISLTMPYPGMTIVWDEWEDGYELNALNPLQSTTKIWGDGNPYNGIAPGYPDDIIPAGGSIVLDNTMPANPRNSANVFYDGRDKITASGQVAVTQVSGEPTRMPVQDIKTNVTSTFDFGQSFTIPLGQNYPDKDFAYTALFIRAEQDSTTINIDKDNNGTFETSIRLNEGGSYLVNGGVMVGATITSDKPVGVELNAGGIDQYSIRNAPIYPASWYSNTYYTPVPTSDNPGDNPKDTAAVMFYNSLNRPITINWTSGAPANGTITLPAKTAVRYPLAYSTTAAYKFYNPTGESFTAIEICDSYTPGGGGNDGTTYDWAFNLIADSRLTDFATTAWAPGGLDLVAPAGPDVNANPIWVTPSANTTVYVKYDGKVSGNVGSISPCGLRYDVAINLNALNYTKIKDPNDNDQSGIAIYTCNGAKLAAVYGEDPTGAGTGIGVAYWDVGTTILPFCKQKLIFANDDYARTMVNQPVTIPVLINDFGFLAVVDPTSVSNTGLLLAKHGTISINTNGTIIYTPNTGYVGKDTFQYSVCSTPSPIVCDNAYVYVDISVCPAPFNENVIAGQVFLDKNGDGLNNDGATGVAGAKVYLYVDGNCNAAIDANELKDSITVDASGTYQFITYPERFVADDFDGPGGTSTCASGSDGNAAWLGNWTDIGDPSVGFCNNTQSLLNTDAEIAKDGAFGYALRLKDNNVSATRTVNLSGASYAFLTFSYRRKSPTLIAGHNVTVQASSNGVSFGTVFTIAGDGTTDPNYVTIYNQDITAYASATTYIRFITNNVIGDADTVYIDNVKVQFLRYPQCYIVRMNPATVPANYHTTTVLQRAFTATSSQTCLAPFDFGIAKNKIAISGTLYNDANGLVDNIINGNVIGTVTGSTVYAYLTDTSGRVAYRAILNSVTGAYNFPSVDVLSNYNLQLSTISVNVGDLPPTNPSLPAGFVPTGDSYGVNNLSGVNIKPGLPNCSVGINTGTVNITAVNFGVEKLPDSDDKTVSYGYNVPGTLYAVPGLTGTDPEDGIYGNGNTYKITSLPSGAVLYYNSLPVTLNQVITSFNSSLLKIDPDDPTFLTYFTYASKDAAGMFDPSPARVTINWGSVLPVDNIVLAGNARGKDNFLTWSTESEINSDHFEIENSVDGTNFTSIGTMLAKGNSSFKSYYNFIHHDPAKVLNYYRIKLVNKDGKVLYSNVITIKPDSDPITMTVLPNPFNSNLTVAVSLNFPGKATLAIVDMYGKTVKSMSITVVQGYNTISVNNLEELASGTYILQIKDQEQLVFAKVVKVK